MPNDRENLAEALMNSNNIFNKITALQMNGVHGNTIFDVRRDVKMLDKIEKKVYKLFLKLVTPDVAEKLVAIDTLTDSMISKVEDRTGWSITEDLAFKEDNFKNVQDPEFRSWDTYRVYRNKTSGFYVSASKTNDVYEENIRFVEKLFFKENEATLAKIHELWAEKENIMSGNYTLKNPTPENEEMAQLIAIYLNYQPSRVFENKEESTVGLH